MQLPTHCVLPGYEAQLEDSGVSHSKCKLRHAAQELQSFANTVSIIRPCQSEEETWAYRCICSFQLIQDDSTKRFAYAMRRNKEPVSIEASFFPIANKRIQKAMTDVRLYLNEGTHVVVRENLTSVTFASSWFDDPSCDCFVTLHYNSALQDEVEWKASALELCNRANFTHVTGRSRKRCAVVKGDDKTHGEIQDTLWLVCDHHSGAIDRISFVRPAKEQESVSVQYSKPETAFFHPNSNAMLQALHWMMSHIHSIVTKKKSTRLLEMYCGCGAHTVALARTALLDVIVAVEYDARLVDACKANCRTNGCYSPHETLKNIIGMRCTHGKTLLADPHVEKQGGGQRGAGVTPVVVLQGDASEWARKSLHAHCERTQTSTEDSRRISWYNYNYDMLLVDPPRAGLGENVCNMAIGGPFSVILYISCGRDALKRDLQRLTGSFEVVDCTLLDLFPRTDSVESLVYLRRRREEGPSTTQ